MDTSVHGDKTQPEDNVLCILEFANGAVGLVENSWAKRGGMDDRIDLRRRGPHLRQPSDGKCSAHRWRERIWYAVEKAPDTRGWSFPVFEELCNYGFPREMAHFARCVRGKKESHATGEDGLLVLKTLCAGYASAGEGGTVAIPFRAKGGESSD